MSCGTMKAHGKAVAENAKEAYAEMKILEAFEEIWGKGQLLNLEGPFNDPRKNQQLHAFALGYKASREALVIELPKNFEDGTDKPFGAMLVMTANAAVDLCRKAIEAAGVKVKS